MRLNAPKVITWWIALILAVLGVIAQFLPDTLLADWGVWLVVVSAGLLLLATVFEGL